VGIEAAVRQAGLFHDGGQSDTIVPSTANGTGCDVQDAVVGQFLAAGGGWHDVHHITSIILFRQHDRQSAFVEECLSYGSITTGRRTVLHVSSSARCRLRALYEHAKVLAGAPRLLWPIVLPFNLAACAAVDGRGRVKTWLCARGVEL